MLSVGHLVCEDTAKTSVTIRRTSYRTFRRWWLIAIGAEVVTIGGLAVGHPAWASLETSTPFLAWFVAVTGCMLVPVVSVLVSHAYARFRAAERSIAHPQLQKSLTLRFREPEEAYRAEVPAPEVTIDGRAFEAGRLVKVAVTRTCESGGTLSRALRAHLVFEQGAIELDEFFGSLRIPELEAEAMRFAEALAARLGCGVWRKRRVHDSLSFYVNDNRVAVVVLLAFATAIASALFSLFSLDSSSNVPIVCGVVLNAVTLVLNALVATWGVTRFVRARERLTKAMEW
jgi:hypothetical protein